MVQSHDMQSADVKWKGQKYDWDINSGETEMGLFE